MCFNILISFPEKMFNYLEMKLVFQITKMKNLQTEKMKNEKFSNFHHHFKLLLRTTSNWFLLQVFFFNETNLQSKYVSMRMFNINCS